MDYKCQTLGFELRVRGISRVPSWKSFGMGKSPNKAESEVGDDPSHVRSNARGWNCQLQSGSSQRKPDAATTSSCRHSFTGILDLIQKSISGQVSRKQKLRLLREILT